MQMYTKRSKLLMLRQKTIDCLRKISGCADARVHFTMAVMATIKQGCLAAGFAQVGGKITGKTLPDRAITSAGIQQQKRRISLMSCKVMDR